MGAQSFDQIEKDIKAGKLAPIYFFYGPESYFINALTDLTEKHVLKPGEEAFNKTVFYGRDSEAGHIVEQVRRFPMMAERQLVMLKEAHALKDFASLQTLFDKPVATTVFVVSYPVERVDKRKKIFKSVMANAVVMEAKKIYENKIPSWLGGHLKAKKMTLSPRAISLLVEYLGNDLEKMANAVDKLAIASEGKEVSDKLVEDTIGINRSFNVFDLQEAIGNRNPSKILKIAEVMEKDIKNNPLPMVVGSLFNYISKLYMIKPLGSNTKAVGGVIRVRSDFVIKKYIAAAKKYAGEELEVMIHTLRDYDLKSKGVNVRDVDNESLFREMLLRLVHGV